MYLERLQIHGFKSFGKKTTFKFTDGITVIVGPNGCGKSNVVDAIRWVLGEQKAGLIRSERMENVIFNGAKGMKPLGMAEVSLTIQNTRNVLPVEYSEVVITRRLFRSLESQYLLNNAPCRLKDIQNLFMDTGMGPDAYSIIELSMVESILNGKPEERRRIFEEAAGVTKYKQRRKAAFRKLEATEADLQRLNDIISEVEKNVASLQRQVRKAQRYQELKEVLKEKELRLATYEYSRIKAELEPLVERFHGVQDRRAELSATLDQKDARIEKARLKLLETERELNGRQKELNEISAKIQKKEEAILVDRERRKALQEAQTRLTRDREEVQARLERSKTEIVEFQESLQRLFEQIQVAETEFQEKSLELKALEVSVQEKRDKLQAVERQRLATVEGITHSKQEEERLKTQLENAEQRIRAIEKELEENALLEKIRAEKTARLEDQKAELDSELRLLQERQHRAQKEIKRLEAKKERLKEAIVNQRGEWQTIKERIELLKKFIESYEDHPEGVQHLLSQGYLNGGCKGTLAELLSVAADYRKAIETALGEAAVSLIVEQTDQALQCIEVLKSEEKGPVTFFPLDRFRQAGARTPDAPIQRGGDGVVDWAYKLVECGADFRPVVESLLSDYVVVEDLAAAQKLSARLRDYRLNLITLNGEIVSTWGPIKGGTNGSAHAGVIGRKALVEELEEKSKRVLKQLEERERHHEELMAQFERACAAELKLGKQIKEVEHKLNEVEMQLAQLRFEAKKEGEARERLQKERETYRRNHAELAEEIAAIAPSLADMAERRTEFDAAFQALSEELSELETQLAERRAVVQECRVRLADLKSEERHLQENITKQNEFERELKQTLQRIEEERQAAAREYEELEQRIEVNKKAVEHDFEAHREMEAVVSQIEETYQEDKGRLEEEEKGVRELRRQRDEVSEELHSMELRISELKMGAEHILERMKEEYDLKIKAEPIEEELDTAPLSEEIEKLKTRLHNMEPVNLLALTEYEKEKERLDFLNEQKNDLIEAESNLNETIRVINKTAREQFSKVFEQVRQNFIKVFKGFFESGVADLKLAPNQDPLEAEILIEADPKGRRIAALSLLSGGEKALTAISLLFAIYLVKPSPFCILDEVDAPLDDANIGRFINAIRQFANDTQFIIITHNKLTMRAADCLYGVTMEEEGVSKVVSVSFKELDLAA